MALRMMAIGVAMLVMLAALTGCADLGGIVPALVRIGDHSGELAGEQRSG